MAGGRGTSVAVDSAGNVITAGRFFGKADLDSREDTLILDGNGYFIAKYDPTGKIIWGVQLAPVNDFFLTGDIATDGQGNVYATGYFKGNVDFDPGQGTVMLSKFGNYDVFILKLDADGIFQWAKQFGGPNDDFGTGLSIQGSNIYLTGAYQRFMEFGAGQAQLSLTAIGRQDVFVAKLNTDGNVLWTKSLGGYGDDIGRTISVGASGNVYISGYFSSNGDFDPAEEEEFTLFWGGGDDTFIVKLDGNGSFVWARSVGGKNSDRSVRIGIDQNEHIYVTGDFYESGDFDPSPKNLKLTSMGKKDIFILKLNSGGDLLWANSFGGESDDEVRSMTIDNRGNLYLTGAFTGRVDFDPGVETVELKADTTYAGMMDGFVMNLTSDGKFRWARPFGSEYNDIGYAIAADKQMNVFITGMFKGKVDFDPSDDTLHLSASGGDDYFLLKFVPIISSIDEGIAPGSTAMLSSVITHGPLYLNWIPALDKALTIQLYSLEGNLLKEFSLMPQPKLHIDLSDQPQGTYLLKLTSGSESFWAKVNVVK